LAAYGVLNIDKKKTGLILGLHIVFYNALFELSNEDRHRILILLKNKAMNVTQIAKVLALSLTETSRHMSRLVDIGITGKDSEGLYHIKPFGTMFLTQIQGAEFITNHRNYFNSHTLEHIPQELNLRLGDLQASTYVGDVMRVFFNVNRVMAEAEEYFWSISDQYIMSTLPLVKRLAYEGIKARSIDLKGYIFPPEMKESVSEEDIKAAYKARALGRIEMKTLDRIDVFLWMSEKEVGALAFPTLENDFDYLGYTSKDKRVLKWCSDLFLNYWDRAESKTEFSLF
jgi:predicted transcriptional regulator